MYNQELIWSNLDFTDNSPLGMVFNHALQLENHDLCQISVMYVFNKQAFGLCNML